MPYYRRGIRAPLKTDKHEITWSNLAQDASTSQVVVLGTVVASADKNASTEIEIGSHVRGIYLEFNISAETITNPKVIHWKIYGQRTGETITAANTYYQTDRSRILKRGMEMLPRDVATVFKRIVFVRIPKSWRRMQANMTLNFAYICSSAEAINNCGFAIYKELY